ncbi:DNA alkylation repair protein [Methylosinus sp. Sm6]|uniref:DNA alkylation repair protein n=1 Tax=Methylosinus sp. Sm6 TaxID=2866948 RepID=UPI001C99D78F|nr:DNA alkylation repair protein [Methylosinus sp. Sm6]MBY6239605.1 DNA alkylation repair protein [Methylosinus sp. Sm6]
MSASPGRRVQDIDSARLALLNSGQAAAATLTECLAVDFAALMEATLPDIGTQAIATMREAAAAGIAQRMRLAARLVREALGPQAGDRLRKHSSDSVRGWTCFIVGAEDGMTLDQRLAAIRPLADDPHFGVREWAWMAVRPHLAADLDMAVSRLAGWSIDPSERIRRFTSEALRPRGVWCAHIATLKKHPEIALPVLELLRSDPSVYVQNSVGNWLNDASKDQPDWVRAICARWQAESPVPQTTLICRRALRVIDPKTRQGKRA